jgi:putative glycerol-1-phosphate prenyltransferase
MIAAVRASLEGPLIVGGGIRSARQLEEAYIAGADIAVVGTAIEEQPLLLPEMVALRNRLNIKAT